MSAVRSQRYRPRVEGMEERILLAGNVVASVVRGDLLITGDNLGNAIRVYATGPSQYTIIPVNASIYGATTINSSDRFIANGVTRDVLVKMQGGNDFVHLLYGNGSSSLVHPRDVKIDGSAGDDVLWVDQTQVRRNLELTGGDGQDQIPIYGSRINGTASIDAGRGNDNVALATTEFGGAVTIAMGDGDDVINAGLQTSGPYGGSTFKAAVQVSLGNGGDSVGLRGSKFLKAVTLSGNPGNDVVFADASTFKGAVTYNGNAGADTLTADPAHNTLSRKPKLVSVEKVNA